MAGRKKTEVPDVLEGGTFKEKAQLLRNKINQDSKKTIVQTYSDDDDTSVRRDSSGILELDLILGGSKETGYGWARGRMHGISGPESTGKSTIVMESIREGQKRGIAVLCDSECVYDPSYAQKLGVNIDELLVINPDNAEEAYDSLESLIKTGDVSLVVIDSLDGLYPKQMVEASAEDQFMGLQARINNRFIGKVQKLLLDSECTLIIVSQIREKIGVMYGSPETVQGGRGLKFYASTRVDVRRDEEIKVNGNPVGHTVKFKTIKNKTASPQQVTYARLNWGEGFDRYTGVLSLAVKQEIVQKGGAGWYTYKGKKIQGDVNFVEELKTNPEMMNEILEALGMK